MVVSCVCKVRISPIDASVSKKAFERYIVSRWNDFLAKWSKPSHESARGGLCHADENAVFERTAIDVRREMRGQRLMRGSAAQITLQIPCRVTGRVSQGRLLEERRVNGTREQRLKSGGIAAGKRRAGTRLRAADAYTHPFPVAVRVLDRTRPRGCDDDDLRGYLARIFRRSRFLLGRRDR